METTTEKVSLRKYTIDSTVKNGMPDVARYTRPNGTDTTVILHEKKDYARMSSYGSKLFYKQDGYKFFVSRGVKDLRQHYTVRLPLWGHFFELDHETFSSIITMHLWD